MVRGAGGAKVTTVMYTDATGFGGAELHLASLAAALRSTPYRPLALLHPGSTDARLSDLLGRDGVPVVAAPRPTGKTDLGSWLAFRRALSTLDACAERVLLHCHQATPYSNHMAMAAAWSLRVPIVCTEHAYYPPDTAQLQTRRTLMQAMIAQDVAVSRAVARSLVRDLGQRPDKIVTIYNGIEPASSSENAVILRDATRTRMRDALGIATDTLVVGTVGRQSPEKNLPALIDAVARLGPSAADVVLLLCGEGDEQTRAALRTRGDEAGLGDRLLLPGRLDDLPGVLAALDVFALPSLTEGMPLSLMEAMAAGVAVVATAVGGVPELVRDGTNGLLVEEPSDTAALSAAIARLLAHPTLRADLAQNAARTVKNRFSFDRMIDRIQLTYDHVIRRSSA
ncbi:MAG: glycosyltransferase family 4 protein [Actinobacteria bacterium]|nr:glycosyltransferase family 4 protein [Actinomycetota bacterium]